jgi:hypothetical protein
MTRIWAIARQTIAESIRMKIALIFIAVIGLILVGLPFSLRNENSVSGAVQSFLSFSLGSLGFLLAMLTIFLSRSLSDEMVNRQILILMSKPIPRWQFVAGKWLGITAINLSLLTASGVFVYGTAKLMARMMEPRDELDRERVTQEVLTARHATSCTLPDFRVAAEEMFRERLEQGVYAEALDLQPVQEKARLAEELEARWRTIPTMEMRRFDFQNVRCERSPDKYLQVRYLAEVWSYAPDEILRVEFLVGNPDKDTPVYRVFRRDIIGRYHTFSVPTNAVAPDRTLTVVLNNRNPYPDEPQPTNTIALKSRDDVQVLFKVGTFGGNLVRQLALLACKLVFLGAFALLTTCLFSFPVSCLLCFTFLALATMSGFLEDAIIFFDEWGTEGVFKVIVEKLYDVLFFLIPNFSEYDGLPLLVDGRNVTLRWVLSGIVNLVFVGTFAVLMTACVLFHRREVAEVSV